MDILLNQLIQFYLNNALDLPPPSTPHITPCYTHKMAIVIVTTDYVTSLQPMYSNAAVSTGVGELGFS